MTATERPIRPRRTTPAARLVALVTATALVGAGALMEAETPNQIIGVLAHETGHIAGGHLSRMRDAIASATTQSIIAMLLGAGALVAASRSGGTDLGQAGMAALAGPSMAIQNTMFGYMRAQEEQADRAGVKFLT